MNMNRITEIATNLRTMATTPAGLDVDKLLAAADELDKITDTLPDDLHFIRSVLSQYHASSPS